MRFPHGTVGAAGGASFLPTDISDLELWLDADDSSTITESSGDVSQWDDKSTAGNDVAQGTTIQQPNTSTINGNASILFDGDATDANADVLRDSTASITSPPATIAIVFTPTSVSAGTFDIFKFRDVFDQIFRIRRDGSALEVTEGGGPVNEMRFASLLAVNETRWVIARWRNSGGGDSDSLTDEGNTDTVTASASINASIDDINVGANANGANAYAGHIHEVIYYNRFITDGERTDLDAYLDAKWTLS